MSEKKSFWQRLRSMFDPNEKYLRTIMPLVRQINALEPEFETLSQQDLQDRLRKIKSRVAQARDDVLAAQADLPEATDTETRRKREKEVVKAEKAVLDAHLPEVFAAVREGAKRTLSMRHFDVQLLGGIVLHEGRISEMKTGEGKTLTATLPLVLNALAGRGAHLVTVNDYLARRDAEWMGKIYRYLGLTVGVIQHDLSREQRQRSYGSDITYITNHEIGFDYLRDHSSAWRPEHLVIRELYYAIIDEVDSILIDEARVPLIISASRGKPVEKYRKVQEVVARLVVGTEDIETKETTGDVIVDEKSKNATLTEDGQRKVEIGLGIDNLNDSAHIEDMHLVSSATKANFCYKRDVDYIVGPTEEGVIGVVIVDTFTGRPQPGRRWSDGLHQAIEAKERVAIQDEQQTIATVTYQNFFLMYQKLAGMTGTAKTEEAEFVGIYEMSVVVVPTNRPMVRLEHADVVYKNEEWKFRGICAEIVQFYCRRQPVLVGTRSVETSERISRRLKPDQLRMALQFALFQWYLIEHERQLGKEKCRELRERSVLPIEEWRPRELAALLGEIGIDPDLEKPENFAKLLEILEVTDEQALRDVLAHGVVHEVLNARHHEREATIVAQAGRLGAVTIATNMAGRGTDIVLGGNPEPDIEALLEGRGIDPKSLPATLFMNAALKGSSDAAVTQAAEQGGLPKPVLDSIASIRAAWQAEHEDVVKAGGLHILGTERLESRRIDNQLRGRSGRQGDPGSARFYISLQDELLRLFGPERWGMLMNQWPEEQPVEHRIITRSMDNAQRKVEGRNFDIRKNTLRYDDVMNVQRLHIYAERGRILHGVDLRNTVGRMMGELVDKVVNDTLPADGDVTDEALLDVWNQLNARFPLKDQLAIEDLQGIGRELVAERLRTAAERAYDDKENDFVRAVVEFELATNIHETLGQLNDRHAVVAVLNALWPLESYLPARLEGVADSRVPDLLFAVAREALEARPRDFITAVIGDRTARAAAAAAAAIQAGQEPAEVLAELRAEWPLDLARELGDLSDAAQLAPRVAPAARAAMERGGWTFVQEALRRHMDRSVDEALPAACDIDSLAAHLDSRWPLGGALGARQLETFNYGVIEDKLHRAADEALAGGGDFLARAAAHRLLRAGQALAAEVGDDRDGLARRLNERFRGLSLTAADLAGDLDAALAAAAEAQLDTLINTLVLEAAEEAVAKAAFDAHRLMSAPAEGDDAEESLEYGDLSRLVDTLNTDWALEGALNAWSLERLEPVEMRKEMVSQVRLAVQTRGAQFVHDTAQLRLGHRLRAAIAQHYSLAGLCTRLNQHFELPGTFDPALYGEARTNVELIAALTETAAEALEDPESPEQLNDFNRNIRAWVEEGWSLRRLCDKLNAEFRPKPKLEAAALAEVAEADLEAALRDRLSDAQEAVQEQFVFDVVRTHLELSIDEALHWYYDVRSLSTQLAAQWPVRPDAVRASKLKGWPYNELGKRLKETLHAAYRGEEWRFIRRFVLRQMEIGLGEAMDRWAPAGLRRSEWDLDALAAELRERWPLEAELDPRGLRDLNHSALRDELIGAARRLYAERERAFIRDTAAHRFGRQLEGARATHYSLEAAAKAVNERWAIGEAFAAADLARLRGLLAEGEQQARAELARLTEPVLDLAEATLLRDALDRRIVDSVEDVLRRHYNTSRLVNALLGKWPVPFGGLSAAGLRAQPYREMVDKVRHLLQNADGSVRRRLLFHNLRETALELDSSTWLPADRHGEWRPAELATALNKRLPLDQLVDPATFSAGLLATALAGEVAAAAGAITPQSTDLVRRAVTARVASDLRGLMRVERRPQTLYERLGQRWPVASANPDAWRGKSSNELREALEGCVSQALAADPRAFLSGALALWVKRTLDETFEASWPSTGEPGPWVLAQICQALNQRWRQPDLLHPTSYKQFERDMLREALLAAAAGVDQTALTTTMLAELAREDLEAQLAGATTGGWELDTLSRALAGCWPGQAPSRARLAECLTPAAATRHLLATVEALEPRVIGEYSSEAVQRWLEGRLEAALDRHCSLKRVCAELATRWPIEELDANRLGQGNHQQVREALVAFCVEASHAGGPAFVHQTAQQRLAADIAAAVAGGSDDGESSEPDAVCKRWGLVLAGGGELGERLQAAAARVEVDRAFRDETLRRWLRQSVEEAQNEHCNPEIAADRWDQPAFVAALERLWPIAGRLTPAQLAGLNAPQLRELARTTLLDAFEADAARFIREATRLRLVHSVHDALAEHTNLDKLIAVLNENWPRETRTDTATLARERLAELAPTLFGVLVDLGLAGGATEEVVAAALAGALPARPKGGPDELRAAVDRFATRWPDAPALELWALDERLVSEALKSRLWREFAEDPRAFVRAVALEEVPRQLERRLMLEAIDTNWCNHLEAMDYLREGINLRGYAQTDPFIAYRKEGRTMFENMLGRIGETVCGGLFETTDQELVDMHSHGRLGLQISVDYRNVQELAAKAEDLTASQTRAARPARGEARRPAGGGGGAPEVAVATQTVTVAKVGRNDPCPCGSGKKYKLCCGRGG